MALAFDRSRTTHDIDARIDQGARCAHRSSARDRAPQWAAHKLVERTGSIMDAGGTRQETLAPCTHRSTSPSPGHLENIFWE